MTNQESNLIQDLTGSRPVFPGHPLVVAASIIDLYGSFSEAAQSDSTNTPAALRDGRVPGSGDHAYAAVDVLALGHKGGTVDEMIAAAADYWTRGNAGGYPDRVEAGIAQAKAVEPWFRTRAASWCTGLAG